MSVPSTTERDGGTRRTFLATQCHSSPLPIAPLQDEATVDLPRLAQEFPYAVTDQGYTLRGTLFNISITWNVMPRVGRLYTRTQAFGPWELPQDYQTLQKEG